MSATPISSGPLPFKLANAYGVQAPRQVQPTQPVQRAEQARSVGGDTGANASRITRLVAGVVPGKVDFSGDEPRQDNSFALYHHPADANAAATGVSAGRVVDLEA